MNSNMLVSWCWTMRAIETTEQCFVSQHTKINILLKQDMLEKEGHGHQIVGEYFIEEQTRSCYSFHGICKKENKMNYQNNTGGPRGAFRVFFSQFLPSFLDSKNLTLSPSFLNNSAFLSPLSKKKLSACWRTNPPKLDLSFLSFSNQKRNSFPSPLPKTKSPKPPPLFF